MSSIDNKKWSIMEKIDKDIRDSIKSLHIFGTNADQYIIITNDDTVYSFGSNSNGCLGLGHRTAVQIPTKIEELCGKQVTTIEFCSDYEFVLALANNLIVGTVFSWGKNNCGQLGNGNTTAQYKPVIVKLLTENRVIDVKCGFDHALALTQNDDIFMWGFVPDVNSVPVTNPKLNNLAPNQKKIVSIDSGLYHALALTESGDVYCWGDTAYNPSANQPNEQFSHNWSLVSNLTNVFITKTSCGPNHCLLLSSDGSVYAFGANSFGQLGESTAPSEPSQRAYVSPHNRQRNFFPNATNTTITSRNIPQKLNISERFTDIGAVKYYNISVGLTDSGVCYVWGECDGQSLAKPIRFPYNNANNIDDVIDMYSKNKTTFKPILYGGNGGAKYHRSLSHAQKISNGFNNEELSDFAFVIDCQKIYVYKSQLILRCDHFRKMFAKNNWNESDKNETEVNKNSYETNENEIKLQDYSYAVYYAFLKYLYTDTVDIDSKHLIGLLDLANCYLEEELKQRCVKLLKNQVSIDNLCDIHASAVKYNSRELQEYCKNFLVNNNNLLVAGKVLDYCAELKNTIL